MKVHRLAATALVALAAVAACAAPGDSGAGEAPPAPTSITVWLQPEAASSWPAAVEAANATFAAKHPGVEVKVQTQQWSDHLTKLDAALAGSNPPDVVELGNTEMTKYMAGGALTDLTAKKAQFENSSTWLTSLAESVTYDGALYGVPYYAGARAVIYRTDLFEQAGIAVPTTRVELETAAATLAAANAADPNFSAFYLPGQNWYAAMAFVYDADGEIATRNGEAWTGSLDSPAAQGALSWLKGFTDQYSKADRTGDDTTQVAAFGQGSIGMMLANGWELSGILDPADGNPALAGKVSAFPLPSATGKPSAPSFLGGSDLAVPVTSKAPDLAADWIAAFTGTESMSKIVTDGKQIPNSTELIDLAASDPALQPFATAAAESWFVPSAEGWATVESQNVLQDMLVDIYTGKATVPDATTAASTAITQTLNGT